MNCCDLCFVDIELRGIVYSRQPPAMGTCDFCHTQDVPLIDATELEESMMTIVRLYEPAPDVEAAGFLHEVLQDRWKLFSAEEPAGRQSLLRTILASVKAPDDPLFIQPVQLKPLAGQDAGAAQEVLWDQFADEIKYGNRFFLRQPIELGLLDNLLPGLEKIYPAGTAFYRGRVGKKQGYALEQMGKPPREQATSGRANPVGIPYLYVAKDLPTTVYESRCTYLDFLSVARFETTEPLRVVSLQGISKISPFRWQDRLEFYLIYEKYLAKLESELSRPLRRFDNALDYLPSEYLCEYFKSLGYDGIEYGSALHPGGVNLAIFNDHKLTAVDVAVHEVISIDLQTREVPA